MQMPRFSFSSIMEGLANAADNPAAAEQIQTRRKREEHLSDLGRQGMSHLLAQTVKGIQTRMSTTDPHSPEFHSLQQTLRQVVGRYQSLNPAKGVGDVSGAVEAAAPGAPADENKFADLKRHLKAVGMSDDDINTALRVSAGIEAKPKVATPDKPLPVSKPYKAEDGKYYQTMRHADGSLTAQAMPEGYAPPATGKPRTGWSRDEHNRLYNFEFGDNNQEKPGSRNYNVLPPAGYLEKIRHGIHYETDASGVLHELPTTTTTTPVLPGSTQSTNNASPQRKAASPSGNTAAPKSNAIYKGSVAYKEMEKAKVKEVQGAETAANYLRVVKSNAQRAKSGDGTAQVAIIAAFIKGLVGGGGVRVTQTEWNQAVQTAPLLTRVGAHFTDSGLYGISASPIAPEQIDSMQQTLSDKVKSEMQTVNEYDRRLAEQKSKDTGTAATGNGGGSDKPLLGKKFSKSQWKKKNPQGDVNAAALKAKAQGAEVVE